MARDDGICLSLARQFAEMHGGTLHASSSGLGKGSEFLLTLPVVVAQALPVAKQEGMNQDIMKKLTLRKILVVDDNVDAADTLEALLGMDGFEVKAVYDGVAAVEAAGLMQPDVIVMDIGMPGMDGYDAARIIRRQEGGRKVTLIALTGWGSLPIKSGRTRRGSTITSSNRLTTTCS